MGHCSLGPGHTPRSEQFEPEFVLLFAFFSPLLVWLSVIVFVCRNLDCGPVFEPATKHKCLTKLVAVCFECMELEH